MSEIAITEDRFFDILFDKTQKVVEKITEKSGVHLTSVVVNGDIKAWREITSEGVIYMEIIGAA